MNTLLKLILILPAKIYLNPIIFSLFFYITQTTGVKPTRPDGIWVKFLIYGFLFFIISEAFFLALDKIGTNSGITPGLLNELSSWNWRSIIPWALTAIVLNIYRTDDEGFIMGYIGMPLILLAILFQFFASWNWISQSLWADISHILKPLMQNFSQMNFAGALVMGILLNPITVFIVTKNVNNSTTIPLMGDLILQTIAAAITMTFFFLLMVLFLWLVKNFMVEKIELMVFLKSYFLVIHPFKMLCIIFSFILMILLYVSTIFNLKSHDLIMTMNTIVLFMLAFSAYVTLRIMFNKAS